MRKIALEEHFMAPGFEAYWASTFVNISPDLSGKALAALSDFDDRRLETMQRDGIEFAVLSLAGPGVQIERDTSVAISGAKLANDLLAHQVSKRPKKYGGFAHLPLQDPSAAADELERSVRELGFCGGMVNGCTKQTLVEATCQENEGGGAGETELKARTVEIDGSPKNDHDSCGGEHIKVGAGTAYHAGFIGGRTGVRIRAEPIGRGWWRQPRGRPVIAKIRPFSI